MDPLFLLFTQGLSQALGSFSIAGVSYWNGIENRRAQEKQQFNNQSFQRELQRDAQKHQVELARLSQEFQRDLSREQHEQRKELQELDQINLHWPLTLRLRDLIWEPEDNQVPGLTVLMSPLRISYIPLKDETKLPPAIETEEATNSLRLFIERYYSVQSKERPVRFIGDAYKQQSIRGDAGVLSIFGLLKGLPTLILEPSLRANGSLELRYAFWGLPEFPKRSPLQGAISLPSSVAPADCFCVVILDYKDTTDRNSRIFEKLRETVTAMHPDGADILFVLNKFIDSHDRHETAEEVAELIASKQAEIQHELGLTSRPQVVLLEAKMWCDAQLAWGPVSLNSGTSHSRISSETRKRCIENCMEFYAGHISKFVKKDSELSAWWKEHRDTEELSDEALQFLLKRIVYPLSGADVFLATLRSRIESRLGALVVRPVFRTSLGAAEMAIGRVTAAATVGSQHSLDAVETVASSLTTMVDTVRRHVDQRWKSVRDMCAEMSKVFVDKGSDGRSADAKEREFLKRIKALPPSDWEALGSLFTNITSLKQKSRNTLESSVCKPLGLVWEQCQSGGAQNITRTCEDVVRQLVESGLSPRRSDSLVSSYAKYAMTVSEWRTEGPCKVIEYQDGKHRPPEADEADEHLQQLAAELEAAIGESMLRFLRLQARQIEDSMKNMLVGLQRSAEESAASEGMSASLFAGVTSQWATADLAQHLRIPEGLFEIQLSATEKDDTREELDRIEKKQERIWWTLWLVKRTVEERIYKNVKYHVVKCPAADGLVKTCLDVQGREHEKIGQSLASWARDALEAWQTRMVNAADQFNAIIKQEAESYRKLSEGGLRGRAARWQQVAAIAESGTKTIGQIEELC
jgi:hypothetical protein